MSFNASFVFKATTILLNQFDELFGMGGKAANMQFSKTLKYFVYYLEGGRCLERH